MNRICWSANHLQSLSFQTHDESIVLKTDHQARLPGPPTALKASGHRVAKFRLTPKSGSRFSGRSRLSTIRDLPNPLQSCTLRCGADSIIRETRLEPISSRAKEMYHPFLYGRIRLHEAFAVRQTYRLRVAGQAPRRTQSDRVGTTAHALGSCKDEFGLSAILIDHWL